MTAESIDHLVKRIVKVQDFLGHQILVENASTCLQFTHSQIPEWEYISEISRRSGCKILCDINNVFVNACDHGFSAMKFIEIIDPDLVAEIHPAGHTDRQFPEGEIRIDTHDQRVCDEVWNLYRVAIRRFGKTPTLIEWDKDLPSLSTLLDEAQIARNFLINC